MTARTTRLPCFSTNGESGAASFTEAVMMSPRPAYRPAAPPRMRMQAIRRAPELSATSRIVPIWIMRSSSALRLGEDLAQSPALAPRERPRLLDAHAVAHLRGSLLVVGHEAARPLDRPLVARLLDAALHLDDDRLLHPVRDDAADLGLPLASWLIYGCFHHFSAAFRSMARRYVWTRAMSRRTVLKRLGFSSWPVAFWSLSFQAAAFSSFSFSRRSSSPCWARASRSFFFMRSPSRTRA